MSTKRKNWLKSIERPKRCMIQLKNWRSNSKKRILCCVSPSSSYKMSKDKLRQVVPLQKSYLQLTSDLILKISWSQRPEKLYWKREVILLNPFTSKKFLKKKFQLTLKPLDLQENNSHSHLQRKGLQKHQKIHLHQPIYNYNKKKQQLKKPLPR